MSRMPFSEGCSVQIARFEHVYANAHEELDKLLQKRHWNAFTYFGICGDTAARFEGMAFLHSFHIALIPPVW